MTNSSQAVKRALEDDLLKAPRVSSQAITVDVTENDVTLRGVVQSFRRRLAAVEIATTHADGRVINDELRVCSSTPVGSHQTQELVRSALSANAELGNETIDVSVDGGVVTLTGTVVSDLQREKAADTACWVRGVKKVNNLIIVAPATHREDEQHVAEIRQKLGILLPNEDSIVDICVANRVVTLSGAVANDRLRDECERLVREMGFLHVNSELTVSLS